MSNGLLLRKLLCRFNKWKMETQKQLYSTYLLFNRKSNMACCTINGTKLSVYKVNRVFGIYTSSNEKFSTQMQLYFQRGKMWAAIILKKGG